MHLTIQYYVSAYYKVKEEREIRVFADAVY
jgi:hypothetical protein